MKKDTIELQQILKIAQNQIVVGSIYAHYKNPTKHYKILSLALIESSEEIAVVYQSLYEPYLTWIRPLSNFLEQVVVGEKLTPRFYQLGE